MASLKRLLVLQQAFLGSWPLGVDAHAYLFEPMSRNLARTLDGAETCPHCGISGGVAEVPARANNQWPTVNVFGSHGLCGDPFQGRPQVSLQEETYLQYTTSPQRTYTAGSSVGFVVAISTHHMGHFEFRLCDRKLDSRLSSYQEGQMCLNQWTLQRIPPEEAYGDCIVNDPRGDCQPIDPNNPGRWYLPPDAMTESSPGAGWSDDARDGFNSHASRVEGGSSVYFMWYKIPEDAACSHCTLQWYWATGNTCLYDEHYFTYFRSMQSAGWNAEQWSPFSVASWATCDNSCCGDGKWGEEYWNCADVEIVSSGPTAPPTPTPPPTAHPTPTPTFTTSLAPGVRTTTATASAGNGGGVHCYNPGCGCPPFENGAPWCSEHTAGYFGYCQESEANCGLCQAVWCSAGLGPTARNWTEALLSAASRFGVGGLVVLAPLLAMVLRAF